MSVSLIRSFAGTTLFTSHAPSQICSITYVLIISNIPAIIWMAMLVFYVLFEQNKSTMTESRPGPESNHCKKLEDVSFDFECLFDFPPCPTTMPQIDRDTYFKSSSIQSKCNINHSSVSELKKTAIPSRLVEPPDTLPSSQIVLEYTNPKKQNTKESKPKVSHTVNREGAFPVPDFIVDNESRAVKTRSKMRVKELPLVKQSFLGIDIEELLLMQPMPSIPSRMPKPKHELFRGKLHKAITRIKKSRPLDDTKETSLLSNIPINNNPSLSHPNRAPFLSGSGFFQIVDCGPLLSKPSISELYVKSCRKNDK